VKVEGDIVLVESCDKELAGQTAADIEQLTRISNRDKRIFQDGIWLTERFGKHI
jgi:large subunit ribosomal protein L6